MRLARHRKPRSLNPHRSGPGEKVHVRFADGERAEFDSLAKRRGYTRSALMRELVRQELQKERVQGEPLDVGN